MTWRLNAAWFSRVLIVYHQFTVGIADAPDGHLGVDLLKLCLKCTLVELAVEATMSFDHFIDEGSPDSPRLYVRV